MSLFKKLIEKEGIHFNMNIIREFKQEDVKVYMYMRLIGSLDEVLKNNFYKNDDYLRAKKQHFENASKEENLDFINKYNWSKINNISTYDYLSYHITIITVISNLNMRHNFCLIIPLLILLGSTQGIPQILPTNNTLGANTNYLLNYFSLKNIPSTTTFTIDFSNTDI